MGRDAAMPKPIEIDGEFKSLIPPLLPAELIGIDGQLLYEWAQDSSCDRVEDCSLTPGAVLDPHDGVPG